MRRLILAAAAFGLLLGVATRSGVEAQGVYSRGGIGGLVLTTSITQACTGANTTETDLWTYTLPAGTLNINGRGVRITVFGSLAANANAKTPRVYFGATALGATSTTSSGNGWRYVAEVLRSGATTQIAFSQGVLGAFANGANATFSPTETLANAIVIKASGQNGTASAGDICVTGAAVEMLR